MESKVKTLLSAVCAYTNFEVEGKKVPIPYVLGYGRWQFWKSGGKGSAEQIRKELYRATQRKNFDLRKAAAFQIYNFMRAHRIGVDCSGFAYHVLDALVQQIVGKGLGQVLLKHPGWTGHLERRLLNYQRHRRIDAAVLLSELNSRRVGDLNDIQAGDMIRLKGDGGQRGHIAVIVAVGRQNGIIKKITYAHSSRGTQKQGPHLGEIVVTDIAKDLASQNWQERTKDGSSYGETACRGYGEVRRLKVLSSVTRNQSLVTRSDY